jgi:hypothetical protein
LILRQLLLSLLAIEPHNAVVAKLIALAVLQNHIDI